MRSQHDDYDEAEAAFIEAANKNPALWAELRSHSVPAQFAYEMGRKFKAMQELGDDPTKWEEKIRAKVLAELKAQNGTPDPTQPAAPPPGSLAEVPSATNRGTDTAPWDGPAPLEDILK